MNTVISKLKLFQIKKEKNSRKEVEVKYLRKFSKDKQYKKAFYYAFHLIIGITIRFYAVVYS